MKPALLQAIGHTAYHAVGLGNAPVPSNPYFTYGASPHRAAYDWSGASGGIARSRVAAESRGLGNADLLESGLEAGQYKHYPAFNQTLLHNSGDYVPTGDWPLWRPAGQEQNALGFSDNEKKLGMVLAAGAAAWLLWKHLGKAGGRGSRRLSRATRAYAARARANPKNPVPHKYEVVATTKRRGKRRYGRIGFTRKSAATEYAESLRKGGHKASVRKKR